MDSIVIGGGFYGVSIALYLALHRKQQNVVLIEQENSLLARASYTNQARVHNGYHYPRSFTTAYRSRINLPRFVQDWPQAVKKDFTKLYAIARNNSKVTAKQFTKFCKEIGASIERADPELHNLFNKRLIEDVFLVEEYAFDTTKLEQWAIEELAKTNIRVIYNEKVKAIKNDKDGLRIHLASKAEDSPGLVSDYVFNCTYSGLNQYQGNFPGTHSKLKHEITEMALIEMPDTLKNIGITVMDGPFFSIMPFPAKKLHTLSHVRYTPHLNWLDEPAKSPYNILEEYSRTTRVDRMLRDVERYIPAIKDASYRESLFEVKTILLKNEIDDGRPILFETYPNLPGLYSVLGGKIDNIYDVLEKLDSEPLTYT
jgi:hypothetical protein